MIEFVIDYLDFIIVWSLRIGLAVVALSVVIGLASFITRRNR